MMDTARPDSWKTNPMPASVAVLNYVADFTTDEFNRISIGLMPLEMEGKWLIFLTGNILNLHRSWTGDCIYQVEFDQDGEKYSVRRATANRDPAQHRETDDAYDSKILNFLIRNFLLGESLPFPIPSDLPTNTPSGVYQHHVSGTAYPETNQEVRPWWK